MREAYIVEAVRSAVGKKNGSLSATRADKLAAMTLKALTDKSGIDPAEVEDVVMGCVTPVGEQGLNIGRTAALLAGFPITVTGTTVNRMCGSSQQSINFAAMGVMSGAQDVVIAAGVESMSRVRMGSDMFYEGSIVPPHPELSERFTLIPQGLSAEYIAQKWGLSRGMLDEFSLESHNKALNAQAAGAFDKEIVALDITTPDGRSVSFNKDEGPRAGSTLEKLGGLRTVFKEGGVITAASSSQISDGSSALLIASGEAVKRLGLKPKARIVAMSTAGVDPTIMLTGPIPATQKVLEKANLPLEAIDIIEINEAFASVALACSNELGFDYNKVNVNGGAIALGHPLGASGARLMTTLLYALEAKGQRYGLSTMCIGYGQGIATIIDRNV